MSNEALEQEPEASPATNSGAEPHPAVEAVGNDPQPQVPGPTGKLVPVNEAIKYRRRAQQAESKLQQYEQKLKDMQAQLEDRLEQLATADAQRDEIQHRLNTTRARASAERMLHDAGVADVETAMVLLEKRTDLSDELDAEQLQRAVEQLLQSKPFLAAAGPSLPGKTASSRLQNSGANVRLAQAAARAASTGSRREVAEYLRLRRQANGTY